MRADGLERSGKSSLLWALQGSGTRAAGTVPVTPGPEERADTASPHRGAPPGGQRQGEVREGPIARVGVPVFATLHGYADLAATGMLTPELAEGGLDDVIAFILRGCAPDARA
ncbi:hypothetical protein ACFQ7N_22345 [Streptomyces niveus]|uniref:hypothetical protein n=1 Tax=Streptomyces niveus TaxID=193462 RepID=UPI0036CEB2B3